MDFFVNSVFFGVIVSLLAYGAGVWIKKKLKLAIFNPLLIAIVIVIVFLAVCHIDYSVYENGAQYISYLLTPATVSLAIPLHRQFSLLKKNLAAVMAGVVAGVVASLACITVLALLFHFTRTEWLTFLPKSVTTAIGIGIAEEMGGYVAITAAAIIITGVFGNVCAGWICRLFRITDPVAKGIAIGSASHAIGTSKAMEMGEVEGAMSSLALVVTGILTVIGTVVIVQFL